MSSLQLWKDDASASLKPWPTAAAPSPDAPSRLKGNCEASPMDPGMRGKRRRTGPVTTSEVATCRGGRERDGRTETRARVGRPVARASSPCRPARHPSCSHEAESPTRLQHHVFAHHRGAAKHPEDVCGSGAAGGREEREGPVGAGARADRPERGQPAAVQRSRELAHRRRGGQRGGRPRRGTT